MASAYSPTKPDSLQEFRDDLRATLAAQRELGPELEDTLATNFLKQIERAVDARVETRLAEYTRGRSVRQRSAAEPISATLRVAIPLVVLAGIFGGPNAIVAVCALVLIVSLVALLKS